MSSTAAATAEVKALAEQLAEATKAFELAKAMTKRQRTELQLQRMLDSRRGLA